MDVICPEEKISRNERLCFYRGYGTQSFLEEHFSQNQYDGIVNFIHYPNVEEYKPIHKLLITNTAHLIFLSSYRVYADLQHPVTETAPMLLDVTENKEFLGNETYALSKAKGEYFLRNECKNENWTIIRPVISFSHRRFDLVTCSGKEIIEKAKTGEALSLPLEAKNLTAGLDWAGNSKVLKATGLKKEDFVSIKEGLARELSILQSEI